MSRPCTDEATKMDPELKVKWLEALRSGDFPQGQGALHDNGKYCCLGVLAQIASLMLDVDGKPRSAGYLEGVIYGSVCSGIEAATVAWHPLGWRAGSIRKSTPSPAPC
jgi:hypothetical protein